MCTKTEKAAAAEETTLAKNNKDRNFWIVDGQAYDFTKFIDRHPGGNIWFLPSAKRDISVLYYGYHVDPSKLEPLLQKYKVTKDDPDYEFCQVDNLTPALGLPPQAFPRGFDARKDINNWQLKENTMLHAVQQKVKQPEHQKKVRTANFLFDFSCYVVIALYIITCLAFFFDIQVLPFDINDTGAVALFVFTRAAFAAYGHYYVHAKYPSWKIIFFDSGYGPTCISALDGHVMMHHVYTHSVADLKNRLFNGMWILPPLWRPLGFTLSKLGMALSGTFLQVMTMARRSKKFHEPIGKWWFLAYRVELAAEFFYAFYIGKGVPFMIQFCLILWYLAFVILSGHDFLYEDDEDLFEEKDWGKYQVLHANDFYITGNKYVDMLLSGGLSSHRVHHILPYQPSGFANIVTEPVVEKVGADFGVVWEKPKFWFTSYFPKSFLYCFCEPTVGMEDIPVWRQHFSPQVVFRMWDMIYKGFSGNP